MQAEEQRELIQEFFSHHPDYQLCRTLADNVASGVTTRAQAIGHLAQKAWATRKNAEAISEKLEQRVIRVNGSWVRLSNLRLSALLRLDDESLAEVIEFYLKHPFAHGRTYRSRWLPRWIRTLALSALVGHARSRELDLDYDACFEMLRLL